MLSSLLAEKNSTTLSGGSSRSLLPAGSVHLLQEPELPGGTVLNCTVLHCTVLHFAIAYCFTWCKNVPVRLTFLFLGASFSLWRRPELCTALAGTAHAQLQLQLYRLPRPVTRKTPVQPEEVVVLFTDRQCPHLTPPVVHRVYWTSWNLWIWAITRFRSVLSF